MTLTIEPYPKRRGIKYKSVTINGKSTRVVKQLPTAPKRPVVKRKLKSGVWTLKKADTHFSKQIRARDGKCMHPMGTEDCVMLQNSHYIGRAVKSTRFDPENCVTICWFHHYKSKDLGFEYQKQTIEKHGFDGQYTMFMRKFLGERRFTELMKRAKQQVKPKQAIKDYQALITLER